MARIRGQAMSEPNGDYIEIVTTITILSNQQLKKNTYTTKAQGDTTDGISSKAITAAIVGNCETILKPLGLGVKGFHND
jgi:hypothetical protein